MKPHSPHSLAMYRAVAAAHPMGVPATALYQLAENYGRSDRAICAALQAMRYARYLRFEGSNKRGCWFLGEQEPFEISGVRPTLPALKPKHRPMCKHAFERELPAQPLRPMERPLRAAPALDDVLRRVPTSVWQMAQQQGDMPCA